MDKIRYERLSKTYSQASFPAVNDFSLGIAAGRLVVILGPSGCGKTTLLKMTNRLVEPTSGTVLLDGADTRAIEPARLRRRMGYVIQQIGLFPHMSVAQNVAVVPDLLGWPAARTAARVDALLEMVHLAPGEYRGRYPAQLSGGQQQRVGLARALAGDPEVLLMDEPFGAVDALTRAELQDEIIALHRRLEKTILFVTHDVEEALRLADDIAVVRAGRLVQYGEPCALLAHPADDFVRALLGADDRVRLLGLLRVADYMRPPAELMAGAGPEAAPEAALEAAPEASVAPGASLRQALSLLLRPGAGQLAVQEGGRLVGQIGLEEIRLAACEERAP